MNNAHDVMLPSVQTLRLDIDAGESSACYTELVGIGQYRLKVVIEIDYFSLQKSSAKISAFSAAHLQWNMIASLHCSHIHHAGSHKGQEPRCEEPYRNAELYQPLRDELLRWAVDILSIDLAPESATAHAA